MDDKTRRVGGQREEMTGRGDESARSLDSSVGSTANQTGSTTRASNSARRTTSGTRKTTTGKASDQGLDRETDARTRELQAEIADTREELSETIEAIQERLRPGNVVSQATESVKEKARASVRGLTDNAGEGVNVMMREVKHNAVPALMIGAGVAWMLMDRSRHQRNQWDTRQRGWSPYTTSGRGRSGEYGRDYETNYVAAGTGFDMHDDDAEYSDIDYRRSYGSQRRGLADDVSNRASHMMEGAKDRWQRTTRNTTNGLQRLMRDNPLLVGAAAVLVGAAVGAALPETERENEIMGETRDNMINQAQEMAQNAASTVKEVASNIPTQVTEAVTSKVVGESGGNKSDQKARTNQPVGTTGPGQDDWRRE
jgi:hypothetical protein